MNKSQNGSLNAFSIATIIIMMLYVLPQTVVFIHNDIMAIIATVYYIIFISRFVSPAFLIKTLSISVPYLVLYWINGFPNDFKLGFVLPFMTLWTLIMPVTAVNAIVKRNNQSEQKLILVATGICLLYVCFSTFKALTTDPLVMRRMAGGDEDITLPFRIQGVGGYGFAYSMGALFIALFCIRKFFAKSLLARLFFIVFIVMCGYLVVQSQYATLLFITILGIAMYYIFEAKTISQKFVIIMISILIILFSQFIFLLASSLFGGEVLQYKFQLIYEGIWGNSGIDNISGDRSQFQLDAFNIFLSSPLIGAQGAVHTEEFRLAHSTILSVLASTGLIGLISLVMFFYYAIKRTVARCFKSMSEKRFYYPVLVFYSAFAFLNPIDYSFDCAWMIFFIVPIIFNYFVDNKSC